MSKSISKRADQVVPSAEEQVADQLTAQYQKAVSGTREVLIFGAMFMGLGVVLRPQNNSSHGPQMKGEGLRGWIETNCPRINYNTAYKFYGLAKKMREELSIPETANVHRLLTAPINELTKQEASIRVEIDDAIEGKSAYQLEIGWGIRKDPKLLGNGMAGNQNAKKNLDDPERQMANAKLRVEMEVSEAVAALGRLVDNKSIAFMGLKGMRVLAEELERMAEATRKCLKQTAEERAS